MAVPMSVQEPASNTPGLVASYFSSQKLEDVSKASRGFVIKVNRFHLFDWVLLNIGD